MRSRGQLLLYWEPHTEKTSQLFQISEIALKDFQRKLGDVAKIMRTYLASGKVSPMLLRSHLNTLQSLHADYLLVKAKFTGSTRGEGETISRTLFVEDRYIARQDQLSLVDREDVSILLPTQLVDMEDLLKKLILIVSTSLSEHQRKTSEFREMDKLKFTVFAASSKPPFSGIRSSPSMDNLHAPVPRRLISAVLLIEDVERIQGSKSFDSKTLPGSVLSTIKEVDEKDGEI